MLPALADEVKVPERDIPRGMSTSVLIATFSGEIFLLPIMVILPDLSVIYPTGTDTSILPIVKIFMNSTESMIVSYFLVLLILGNLFFSGIGSITASSRTVYSFSRDHAIPRYEFWTDVKPESQSQVPKNSIILSMCISYLLGLIALVSTAAFNAFIGAAVLCLCSGTCIPLVLVLFQRRRILRNAPVKIRYKLGWGINITSILWLFLAMFSVCLPVRSPVTFRTMNYALVVYVLCLICITTLYFTWGRYNFNLPQCDYDTMGKNNSSGKNDGAAGRSNDNIAEHIELHEYNAGVGGSGGSKRLDPVEWQGEQELYGKYNEDGEKVGRGGGIHSENRLWWGQIQTKTIRSLKDKVQTK